MKSFSGEPSAWSSVEEEKMSWRVSEITGHLCTVRSLVSLAQKAAWYRVYKLETSIYFIYWLIFFSPASEMFVKERIKSISSLLIIMKACFYFIFLIVYTQHCYLSFPEHHCCTPEKKYSPENGQFWGRFSVGWGCRFSHRSRLIVHFYYSDFHMNVCLNLLPPNSLGNMFIRHK